MFRPRALLELPTSNLSLWYRRRFHREQPSKPQLTDGFSQSLKPCCTVDRFPALDCEQVWNNQCHGSIVQSSPATGQRIPHNALGLTRGGRSHVASIQLVRRTAAVGSSPC